MKSKLTETQREKMLSMIKNGTATKQITEEFSVSAQYVNRLKKKNGIVTPKKQKKKSQSEVSEQSEQSEQESVSEQESIAQESEIEDNKSIDDDNVSDNLSEFSHDGEYVFQSDVFDTLKQDQVENKKNVPVDKINAKIEELEDKYGIPTQKQKDIKPKRQPIKNLRVSKREMKLTKKDIAKLRNPEQAQIEEEMKSMSKLVKEKAKLKKEEDDNKRPKLLFKLTKMAESFPDNIIVKSVFNNNLDEKNILKILKKKKVDELEELTKTLKNNIILESQMNSSNNIPENTILMSSAMIENILGSFVNIKGYARNMNEQIHTNETLKSSLELYKLDAIDWMSMSPSSLIGLTLAMTLMSTYQQNRFLSATPEQIAKMPVKPVQKEAPPKEEPKEEVPENEPNKQTILDEINNKYTDL